MKHELFPNQRTSKLSPRGDGPFKVLERINDNAYKIDLPFKFQVSNTFNVTDLPTFDTGPSVLRSKPSQEGGNDEDIPMEPDQGEDEPDQTALNMPFVPNKPLTRAAARSLHQRFNGVIRRIMEQLEHLERTGESVGQVLKPLAIKPPDKGDKTIPDFKHYQDVTKTSGHSMALKEDPKGHLPPEDEDQNRPGADGDATGRDPTEEDRLATIFGQLTLGQGQTNHNHLGDILETKEAIRPGGTNQDTTFRVTSHLDLFNPKPSPLRKVTLSCLSLDEPD